MPSDATSRALVALLRLLLLQIVAEEREGPPLAKSKLEETQSLTSSMVEQQWGRNRDRREKRPFVMRPTNEEDCEQGDLQGEQEGVSAAEEEVV